MWNRWIRIRTRIRNTAPDNSAPVTSISKLETGPDPEHGEFRAGAGSRTGFFHSSLMVGKLGISALKLFEWIKQRGKGGVVLLYQIIV
jgi:hypothetical protein